MRPVFFLLFFFASASVFGQNVQRKIDELVNDDRLRSAAIGVAVMDLETGQLIAGHRPQHSLIPASTQKLITTAVALDLLGPDATFTTRLLTEGSLTNGVLRGNLYIVGGGDPTLGSPEMDGVPSRKATVAAWSAAVANAGIREIQGAVIGDGSYYGTAGIAMDWPWADLGNYYGAGSYGLNWHDNLYYLDITQRQNLGSTPPIQQTRPDIAGLLIHNELRTAARGSGDNAYIYGAPFNHENFLRGTIPAGTGRFTIKGSIPDPPLQAATELDQALRAAGISIALPPTTSRSVNKVVGAQATMLHEQSSPSLEAIARRTNYKSVNLYAETLLREINKSRGVALHALDQTTTVTDYLVSLGLDLEGVQLLDGSGLSPRNYFPPAFMAAFLRSQAYNDRFIATIPLAGRSGSMRNRLKGTAAEGRLYAKSGSLNGARCFAGYAFPASGQRLAFSIMINNYTVSGRELNTLLYEFLLLLCKP